MSSRIAELEAIRSLAFGGISGTYATVGSATANATRLVCFTNNTNADVFFSRDGSTDEVIVVAGGFKLFDVTTNVRRSQMEDLVFKTGTQWYVKQVSGAPTSGSVYIEILYEK